MPNFAYLLCGGAPVVKRYKISATISTAAVPVELGVDGETGIALAADNDVTTDFIGCLAGAGATYSTTQGDAEGTVEVIINPDAVWKWKMVRDGSEAQLDIITNSAASAAGTVLTITTGDPAPNSPDHDQGQLAGVRGANVGQTRQVTSVAATTATVTVPFLNDLAVDDVYILVPWSPGYVENDNLRPGNTLNTAQQTVIDTTGASFRGIEIQWDFSSLTKARQNSYLYAWCEDHNFGQTT